MQKVRLAALVLIGGLAAALHAQTPSTTPTVSQWEDDVWFNQQISGDLASDSNRRRTYDEAMAAAVAGDSAAMTRIGFLFAHGLVVNQNGNAAEIWYQAVPMRAMQWR